MKKNKMLESFCHQKGSPGFFMAALLTILLMLFSAVPVDAGFLSNRDITQAASQQQKRVTGRVIDERGEPLPGVNIVIKGTTAGMVSDMDGNYSLNVTETAVLMFTSVGFSPQEITVGNQVTINVTLREEIKSFEEVVVIGYGTQKKVNMR